MYITTQTDHPIIKQIFKKLLNKVYQGAHFRIRFYFAFFERLAMFESKDRLAEDCVKDEGWKISSLGRENNAWIKNYRPRQEGHWCILPGKIGREKCIRNDNNRVIITDNSKYNLETTN